MPDETVETVGLQSVIGLKRDEHAEAMAKLEYGGDAHESADRSDEQSDVTDGIPVNVQRLRRSRCGGSQPKATAIIMIGIKIQRLERSSARPIARLLLPEKP